MIVTYVIGCIIAFASVHNYLEEQDDHAMPTVYLAFAFLLCPFSWLMILSIIEIRIRDTFKESQYE